MKNSKLIITALFILIFGRIFCQNINENENKKFIKEFINTIKNNDSLTILQFRYFFHDIENETQMSIASEYCKKKLKINCDVYVENIRYHYDQNVIDYFFNKMKQYFHKKDSITDIVRINKAKFLTYVVTIKNLKNKNKYYFNIGYEPNYKNFIDFISPIEREYYKIHDYKIKVLPFAINYIVDSNFHAIIYKLDANNYYLHYLKQLEHK